MKKFTIASLVLILSLSLNAQTKVTKSNIIGKWAISSIEMAGKFYFNIDTDSLSLGAELKAQTGDEAQTNLIVAMIKQQLGVLTKMTLQFNTDGTAILNEGSELLGNDAEAKSKASYTIDEEASSITTKDSDKKENTMKVDILDNKLRIKQTQPEGEFILSLKKVAI